MDFKYNKQQAVALFRKWYISSNKNKYAPYDFEQVSDLTELMMSEMSDVLQFYLNAQEKVFRGKLPILYIRNGDIYTFSSQFMYMDDNTIVSLNTSGCLAVGNSRMEVFKNYLVAITECIDYRQHNRIEYNDYCHYLHIYDYLAKECLVSEITNRLKSLGWTIGHKYHNNSIFIKTNYPSTITIPNQGTIPQSLSIWIEKMNYPMGAREYHSTYGDF